MHPLTWSDIQALPAPPQGRRISYGSLPDQFGDLRLPPGHGPFPSAMLIHGGCWRASISLDHLAPFAAALTSHGIATWSIEYRRADSDGGGYPGTFDDVLAAFDRMACIPELDPDRVVIAGHSAGGHLALWAGAHRHTNIRGAVSICGIPDLRAAAATVCGGMIARLVPNPDDFPGASPMEMLPLRVAQTVITAERDDIVAPGWSQSYADAAEAAGDPVTRIPIREAGHFDLIAPGTDACGQVIKELYGILLLRGAVIQ